MSQAASPFYTEQAAEEPSSLSLMERADADPAMEAKGEEEAQTEEQAATLLESLRRLLRRGQ